MASGAWATHCDPTSSAPSHLSNGECGQYVEVVNAQVPVVGPATNAELRAAPIAVSGPLTNDEMRATPVAVSGDGGGAGWSSDDRATVEGVRSDMTHGLGIVAFSCGMVLALAVPKRL